MIAAFLQSGRAINIATIILGTFAGLYGYYSLLGSPQGILRRFLVAIPSAVVYGAYNLTYDLTTHTVLSTTASSVLQLPISSLTLGIFGAVAGFVTPFAFPNLYREDKEEPSTVGTLLRVILLTASYAVGNAVILRLMIVKFHWFAGHQPTLLVLLAVGAAIGLVAAIFNVQWLTQERDKGQVRSSLLELLGAILALVFAVALIVFAALSYIVLASLIGWALLIYTVLLFVIGALLFAIQYWADHLQPRQLGYISLSLFLAAGVLQLYQAIGLNGAAEQAPAGVITEYAISVRGSAPDWITVGPDHALWFTDPGAHRIGRIAPNGTITQYPLPVASLVPEQIAAGPDDALWFTAELGHAPRSVGWLGRVSIGGQIHLYRVPATDSTPLAIIAGPDGALWFTDAGANAIGRSTVAGKITEYPVPTHASGVSELSVGPDRSLWFTERAVGKIGRMTTHGIMREWSIPTHNSLPAGITPGQDGALWFTEEIGKIGRITTSGQITERALPDASGDPTSIATSPDGALWFTERRLNLIGRMTLEGRFHEYVIPTGGSSPSSITLGPDNAMWFTESSVGSVNLVGKIGRLAL